MFSAFYFSVISSSDSLFHVFFYAVTSSFWTNRLFVLYFLGIQLYILFHFSYQAAFVSFSSSVFFLPCTFCIFFPFVVLLCFFSLFLFILSFYFIFLFQYIFSCFFLSFSLFSFFILFFTVFIWPRFELTMPCQVWTGYSTKEKVVPKRHWKVIAWNRMLYCHTPNEWLCHHVLKHVNGVFSSRTLL